MRVPFAIYADFEALAAKIDTCLPDSTTSSTTHQTKFEACGYAYQVVCTNDNYSKPPETIIESFFGWYCGLSKFVVTINIVIAVDVFP
jgi:hypothetical protein